MQFKNNFFGKLLLVLLGGMVVIVVAVPATLAAGYHTFENPPCYDITGATQPVMVGGVNNGGIMDFNDTGGVAAKYQACVRMKPDKITPDHLEGWVWNSNVGWVSLYCGADGKNLTAACGAWSYSVSFNTTGTAPDAFTSVKLDGYAWGDNTGWISFNPVLSQLKPTASGLNRGEVEAGSPAVDKYTWTDALGWMDWSSVWFHWEDTMPPVPDPNVLKYVSVCSSKDVSDPWTLTGAKCACDLDGSCAAETDPAVIPDANNTDVYDIKVPFVDGGVAIDNTRIEECPDTLIDMNIPKPGVKDYCAKIALTWEDDVDMDQTTAQSQYQNLLSGKKLNPEFNTTAGGAVTKPLVYGLDVPGGFTYDGVNVLWGAKVRSLAPTSDRNTFGGMENEKFYYVDKTTLPDPSYDPVLGEQNLLKLKELKLLFFKYKTDTDPAKCIYGTVSGSNCNMQNYMTSGGTTFSFNPLVTTGKLAYVLGGKELNFISVADPGAVLNFLFNAVAKAAIADTATSVFNFGLQSNLTYDLKHVDALVPVGGGNNAANPYPVTGGSMNGVGLPILGQLFANGLGASFDAGSGPYVYSTVSYNVGANLIKYFGAKVPRIKAGLLLNPVAKVQGNVYVTDYGQKSADVSLKSLGNISSNLRREVIVRNVAKYLGGFDPQNIKTGNQTVSLNSVDSINNLSVLQSDPKKSVLYLKDGDLTIDCSGDCVFDKNVTFIVENGNIFVNSNIEPTGNNQVGLIALRDLTNVIQNKGFLYLDSNVTWLSGVQIYLDRVMQSYKGTVGGFDANGFVRLGGDDYDRQAMFNNQLVIEGTISSMNGVGNASRSTATYETGAEINPPGSSCSAYDANPLAGICRARVTDLNYLRYFGPGLEICKGDEGPNAVDGAVRDQALKSSTSMDPARGCNPNFPTYAIDATGLYSEDPAKDLVAGGGNGVASPYFKGVSSLDNSFPVNFFYKPISKDLGGFEVDQTYQ